MALLGAPFVFLRRTHIRTADRDMLPQLFRASFTDPIAKYSPASMELNPAFAGWRSDFDHGPANSGIKFGSYRGSNGAAMADPTGESKKRGIEARFRQVRPMRAEQRVSARRRVQLATLTAARRDDPGLTTTRNPGHVGFEISWFSFSGHKVGQLEMAARLATLFL